VFSPGIRVIGGVIFFFGTLGILQLLCYVTWSTRGTATVYILVMPLILLAQLFSLHLTSNTVTFVISGILILSLGGVAWLTSGGFRDTGGSLNRDYLRKWGKRRRL
jgi:hypothetical protein